MHLNQFKPAFAAAIMFAACSSGIVHAATAPTTSTPRPPPVQTACPALLQQTFLRLQDEKPQSLCQYSGKVVVVVNTASFCGFTSQYEGLEALSAKYRDQGLVVLGFPSNDFSQESGSNKEIADFCENTFGVKFPMFAKSSVKGPEANALFKQLAARTGTTPRWNFYKYIISRDGLTVTSFNSMADPKSQKFVREIEKELQKEATGK
jgi:glutathione peroxidase